MDSLPIDKHIRFYDVQLDEMYQERKRYIKSPVNKLWKEGKLFFGRIWSYDESKGQLILRFKKNANKKFSLPRLKVPYQLCVVGANTLSSPNDFVLSYDEFRQNKTSITSRCLPIYISKGEGDWRFQGCDQVTMELISAVKRFLDEGKSPLIIIAEEDPPYQYLMNLQEFVKKNPSNRLLNANLDINNTVWNPTNLPSHDILLSHVLDLLNQKDKLIIQGPPGTGKTQLIAEICSKYLDLGKGVCVTSLTNKALSEVCGKYPLKQYLEKGQIKKTNLTSDERKKHKGLKEAKDLLVLKSELLLATYFKLSEDLKELSKKKGKFNVLIIEEASQAYLATIAGFIELGVKVLIVGDPMQMFPIVKNEERLKRLHPKIDNAIRGLEVFSYTNEHICHRIVNTFRLTKDAALQTGIFYDGSLNSISKINGCTNISSTSYLTPKNGETQFVLHRLSASSDELISQAVKLAKEIKVNNESFEIAILSNLKKTVEDIYDSIFEHYKSLNGFTIETIDRIQGMTCDVCIVVVESSSQFAFQLNRFNVATSRSTRGTIFITRKSMESMQTINPLVKKFINNSNKISL